MTTAPTITRLEELHAAAAGYGNQDQCEVDLAVAELADIADIARANRQRDELLAGIAAAENEGEWAAAKMLRADLADIGGF